LGDKNRVIPEKYTLTYAGPASVQGATTLPFLKNWELEGGIRSAKGNVDAIDWTSIEIFKDITSFTVQDTTKTFSLDAKTLSGYSYFRIKPITIQGVGDPPPPPTTLDINNLSSDKNLPWQHVFAIKGFEVYGQLITYN